MVKALRLVILLVCAMVGLSGTAFSDTVIHQERSLYRNLFVTEDSDTRCLRFSTHTNTVQTCFALEEPEKVLFDCNKMILGSLLLRPNPRRILMVGLGGGTLTSTLSKLLPNATIDVVEIDPAMVRVAKEYFNFKPSPRVHITVEDGRVFVKRALARGAKYDLVILDAFDDLYIPTHMLTVQFFWEIQKIMTADGVLAANTYCNTKRYDRESATYQAVFGPFFNLKKFWKNTRVVIAEQDGLPSEEALAQNAKLLQKKFARFGIETSWLLPLFSTEVDWDERAPTLNDQFLPF